MMVRLSALLACGLLLAVVSQASAQSGALDQLYGDGVHAYYSGDYVRAFQSLTAAAQSGSKDPRVFYFRGLACLHLGREPDAVLDFDRGAKLEVHETDRFYDISKALERIQGRDRLVLERHRSQGRLLAQQEIQRRRYERYERIQKADPELLLKDTPPKKKPAPAAAAEDEDPYADNVPGAAADDAAEEPADEAATEAAANEPTAAMEEEAAAEEPAADTPAAADDPFGADEPSDAAPAAATRPELAPL